MGIEAINRGVSRAIFPGSAAPVITKNEAGIVFLDPPYPREVEYGICLEALGEQPRPLIIVQHASKFTSHLKESYGSIRRVRILSQGDNSLSFYEPR